MPTQPEGEHPYRTAQATTLNPILHLRYSCLTAFWEGALLILSLGGTVVCYGVLSAFAYSNVLEWSKYREKYPLESLETRLTYEHEAIHFTNRDNDGRWSLSQQVKPVNGRLETIEEQYDWRPGVAGLLPGAGGRRLRSLAQIHKSNVQLFIESPGFGVFRGFPPPSPYWLDPDPDDKRVDSDRDSKTFKPRLAPTTFLQMHDQSVFDFANPADFGYVRGYLERIFEKSGCFLDLFRIFELRLSVVGVGS